MYSWGDDTSTWNKPGKYKYDSAKAPYLEDLKKEAEEKGPRTYLGKSEPNLQLVDPKGKEIVTNSENPLFVWIDGTGSMQKRPAEIFDRGPLLYQTLSQYRSDLEICFAVLGDAKYDKWPVQVGNMEKGVALDDILKALHAEGRGGPGIRESYELLAYFMQEHVKTPKATHPILLVMGDEKFYDAIDPAEVKKIFGDQIQGPIDSMQVWKNLAQRFDIYMLRKAYPGRDEEILAQWKGAVGDKITDVPYDPNIGQDRVIDVAMGVIAKKWGQYNNFKVNLSARQDSETVAKVEESIRAAPVVEEEGEMKVMKPKTDGGSASKKSVSLTGGK